MTKRICVLPHRIRENSKDNGNRSVILVEVNSDTLEGNSIKIEGPSQIIYKPTSPMRSGAEVWVETDSPIYIDNNLIK